jgi:hypothetical protein
MCLGPKMPGKRAHRLWFAALNHSPSLNMLNQSWLWKCQPAMVFCLPVTPTDFRIFLFLISCVMLMILV